MSKNSSRRSCTRKPARQREEPRQLQSCRCYASSAGWGQGGRFSGSPLVPAPQYHTSSEVAETNGEKTVKNLEQPKSEKIAALIVETETRLTALDKELEAFDTQQDVVVGAETLDQDALTSLCARRAATETEHRALIRRLQVLAQQKSEAERQEAGMRLQAIVAEAERLAEAHAPARAAYDDAVDVLTQTMSALVELHRQHSELGLETVYWMEKYRFPRPSVPQLGELPDFNSLVTTLGQLCASLFRVSLDSE